MIERLYKKCPTCGWDKWLQDFYNHEGSPDGKASICSECSRIAGRLYAAKFRRQHREEFNAYHRQYQAHHQGRPKTARALLLSDL